ncbi:MAG: response regulator transcription factor [Chloroflexi bacterium]|nr:response regulator transcription factor [Chloroflexota bacterium]
MKRHTKTILVIEDDLDVRVFTTRALELAGYNVLQAEDVDTAFKVLAQSGKPDLILLDLQLPGQDGWSFMKQLNRVTSLSQLPVLVFSACVENNLKSKLLEHGADDYLLKPVTTIELEAKIKKIISRKRKN